MSPEQPKNKENLLGLVLNRPMFPWPESPQITIQECIERSSLEEAKEKLEELNQNQEITPLRVITKVSPRAESWQFSSLLDHMSPKQMFRLGNFSNLY